MMLSRNNNNTLCVAQKLSNQAFSNETTPQDDDELQIPLEAFRRYTIHAFIGFHLSGMVSGFKFVLACPSDAVISYALKVYNCVLGTLVVASVLAKSDPPVAGALPSIGDHLCEIVGQIEMGDTDGMLVFQFAQNTSDAAIIRTGRTSFLEVTDFGA
jgi:hypothetical protein